MDSGSRYVPSLERKYKMAISAADRRELDWDLDFETFCRIASQQCHYCHKSALSRWGVGLDRIDNNEGYYGDNVLPCCGPCNKIRGDNLTVEETEAAMEAVLELRKLRR
jgi:hypothetical protein